MNNSKSCRCSWRLQGKASWIWKDCAQLLAPPVCAVLNSSLREGFVPTMGKSVYVCSVPCRSQPSHAAEKHIRPMSLTPVLGKVMESFTRKWIMECVSEDIDSHQYGSVKGSSTVHALVELVHLWQQALDKPGKVPRVLLLDYSKTFDRLDHHILFRKLASIGIPDLLTRWVTSLLCGRRHCTKLGVIVSKWTTINADVPQGTRFEPVGSVIYINDLRTDVNISKYVNDSCLRRSVTGWLATVSSSGLRIRVCSGRRTITCWWTLINERALGGLRPEGIILP